MSWKKSISDDYKKIDSAVKSGQVGNFYIFHGDEHYLRDRCLQQLRKHLCPGGPDGFNYRRFEGKEVSLDMLEDAIDTLPAFAARTLIEIHDYELFSKKKDGYDDGDGGGGGGSGDDSDDGGGDDGNGSHGGRPADAKAKRGKRAAGPRGGGPPPLLRILSSIPDYACLIFVFDTLAYKPDGRSKASKEILKHAQVIEFTVQERNSLVKWLASHYASLGKKIGKSEAEYLIHITGGLMASLKNEVEKTAAYSKGEFVTRSDIDAVVVPVLDAIVYQLSDAIVRREHAKAMRILDELLLMREAPQRLIFSISLKMRQLLAARVCIDSGQGKAALVKMCSLNHDFQAQLLLDTARRTSLAACRRAVIHCARAAYDLNSSPDPESRMTELVVRLANNEG